MSVCRGICLFLSCSPPKSHLYGAQCEWCCVLAECWFVYKWAGIGRGATAEFITNTKNDQRSENVIWKVQTIAAVDTAYCFQHLISVSSLHVMNFALLFADADGTISPHTDRPIYFWHFTCSLTTAEPHQSDAILSFVPQALNTSSVAALGFTLTLSHEF